MQHFRSSSWGLHLVIPWDQHLFGDLDYSARAGRGAGTSRACFKPQEGLKEKPNLPRAGGSAPNSEPNPKKIPAQRCLPSAHRSFSLHPVPFAVSGRPGGPKTEKEEGENGLRLHLAGVCPGQAAQVPRPRALRRHGPRLLHRGGCGLVTPSAAVHPPQPCVCIPLLSCCNFVPPFIPYFFFGLLFYFCIPVTLPSSSVASFFCRFGIFFYFFSFSPLLLLMKLET